MALATLLGIFNFTVYITASHIQYAHISKCIELPLGNWLIRHLSSQEIQHFTQ